MKTSRRRWLSVLCGLVSVAVVGWCLWPEPGPYYQGKSIAYWFHEYCLVAQGADYAHHTEDEVNAVFHQMGTNALPYLVKQALDTTEDSEIATWFYAHLEKMPASWHLPPHISHEHIRSQAVYAIDELKLSPEVILPQVEPAFRSADELQRAQAVEILSNIETNRVALVPWFVKALRFKDDDAREKAVKWLRDCGSNAAPVVPALMALLENHQTNQELQLDAAIALGEIGPSARAAVPRLMERFDREGDQTSRERLAAVIVRIDSSRDKPFRFLVSLLKDQTSVHLSPWIPWLPSSVEIYPQDNDTSNDPRPFFADKLVYHDRAALAAAALGTMGSNATAAIPALVESLGTTNRWTWLASEQALRSIGAAPALYHRTVAAKMAAASDNLVLYYCAHDLLEVNHDDERAHAIMAGLIARGALIYASDQLERKAITNADLELLAAQASPSFREALECSDQVVSRVAADEIKRRAINAIKPSEAK